jgi:hypothetical protein
MSKYETPQRGIKRGLHDPEANILTEKATLSPGDISDRQPGINTAKSNRVYTPYWGTPLLSPSLPDPNATQLVSCHNSNKRRKFTGEPRNIEPELVVVVM